MKHKIYFVSLILTLLLLVACTSSDDATAEPTEEVTASSQETSGRPLVLADISGNPDRVFGRFQPLADYLAVRLGEFGITSGEVRVASDIETMIAWMNSGEIDLYFDSLFPVMLIGDATGAQPILRRWRDGVGEYHSVFFASVDSGITSIEDLNGQLIAFEDASSTSGYLVPAAYLVNNNLTISEFNSLEAEVPDDSVGYIFSNDDENAVQWVISGLVGAGVTDNQNFNELPEETRDTLTIIAETDPVPRQVVLAGPDLDPELIAEITLILLAMDESEEGLLVLDEASTDLFDEFPEGIESALDNMRALYESIQGE